MIVIIGFVTCSDFQMLLSHKAGLFHICKKRRVVQHRRSAHQHTPRPKGSNCSPKRQQKKHIMIPSAPVVPVEKVGLGWGGVPSRRVHIPSETKYDCSTDIYDFARQLVIATLAWTSVAPSEPFQSSSSSWEPWSHHVANDLPARSCPVSWCYDPQTMPPGYAVYTVNTGPLAFDLLSAAVQVTVGGWPAALLVLERRGDSSPTVRRVPLTRVTRDAHGER